MNKSQILELKSDYLHLSRSEFHYLLRQIGQTANSASKTLGRNRHYIAQNSKITPIMIEKYKNRVGDTIFFDGYAAVLERREEWKQRKQEKLKQRAE